MADAYWRYGESRQQSNLPPLIGKRPRSDYDVPSGHELPGYFTRDDERAAHRVMRDTDSIGASYDRYLRSAQISSYGGGDSARPLSGGLSGRPADDPRIIGIGGSDPAVIAKNRSLGLGDGRPELPLPPDATNTLFVEGLPANCTRREVSHIFRPFVGYKEVRLVTKESRHPGGDPLVLCFVDFVSPAHAATAMDALQDKKMASSSTNNRNIRLKPRFCYCGRIASMHIVRTNENGNEGRVFFVCPRNIVRTNIAITSGSQMMMTMMLHPQI